ncbi:MAG: hypothetical protein QOK08_927 [Actinomycetota bacterium]|nr:hypothetical protein [Actinomycetota bacterium]
MTTSSLHTMQWWNDFVTWSNSATGTRIITTAILPFVAIVVAGVLAALIARASSKRVIDHQNREIKAAAIMALIGAGRRAAVWSSLGADAKQHVDSLISEADLRMRLLPVTGAIAAADWAAHELEGMKKNSSNFSFKAEQTFFDYRDRLLDWQLRPAKAKKLFAFDLVQWQYEDGETSQSSLVMQQQEWASAHVEPSTTPLISGAAAKTPLSPVRPASPAVSSPAVSSPATPSPVVPSPAARVASPVSPSSAPTHTATNVATAPSTDTEATDTEAIDAEAIDETSDPVAPPVNAGVVRQRTAPEQSVEKS